jgi:ATP-binding protein involved in chromosome partitioning
MSTAPQAVTEEAVKDALRVVQDPDLKRDIVSLGFIKNVRICGGSVAFDVELTTPACPVKERLRQESHDAVAALPGVDKVAVTMTANVRRPAGLTPKGGLSGVKNAIAIASGKGGVGKSTAATNIAIALARTGATVGLMDADVYGPSIAHMLGGGDRPEMTGGSLEPISRWGIKFMSMGLLTSPDTPVIWRGPMASKLIQQFLGQVNWGELDYLLIDLPPGTGDIQLTLTQSAPLTGAVVVTTPQDVAVEITLRGARMFDTVHVPIIGLIENMSYFQCSHCDERTDVFRHGSGRKAAEELGFAFLGEVPIDPALSLAGDAGEPVCAHTGEDRPPSAVAFDAIASAIAARVSVINENTASAKHKPREIRTEEDALLVAWSDGRETRHLFRELRALCPCAMCVDEFTGKRKITLADVREDVHPLEIRPVGRYAVQPLWSDSHSSGIYSFDYLRKLADEAAPVSAAS